MHGTLAPMQPIENSLPQAGCMQAPFVRYQPQRVGRCPVLAVLRTRSSVDEQGEKVGRTDGAADPLILLSNWG